MIKKLFFLLVGLLFGVNGRILAHGGGTLQIGREPAGPYLVSVWTEPASPQAGEDLHITIGVIDPADDTAVLDAAVAVLVSQNEQPILTSPASTADATNKLFYETDFILEDGVHAFTIQVDGPLGSGETSFLLEIAGNSGINPITGGIVGLIVGAVVGGIAFTIIRRRQK